MDLLHEPRRHLRVLEEVLRVRVHRGARVEQARGRPLAEHRQHPAERGAIDAAHAAEDEERRGHRRAGAPGGHDRVGLALLHERRRDADGRIGPAAQRVRGVLVHRDDFGRVMDLDARVRAAEQRPQPSFLADEHDIGRAALLPIQQRAPDDLVRGVVATHGVDGYAHGVTAAARFALILRTWRPRNVPQCGHAWCGGLGLLHCGQGTRFCAFSARWLRRSPCAACGIRFLG